MRRIRQTHGFTLIELMVVVLITGVIMTAMFQMLQAGQRSSDRSRVMVDLQQNARVGLDALGDDLREVSYGKDPTQPSILYAGPDSVVFVADVIPEEPGAEVITYFLSPDGDPDTENPDDTILMRAVADTSGNSLVDAAQSYGIKAGGLSFRWFNGGGTELENPVPQPEEVGEIFVELTAAGRNQVGDTYPEMTLSTTIYPRNLPLSPARSRPAIPSCDGPEYPNCESATLTWNTPTTNTDGTELQLEDISHFNLYLGVDGAELSPYTRLARTINEWTISDLEGGVDYVIAISCESRSGVESFFCERAASPGSELTPMTPVGIMVNASGASHNISWYTVSSFTNGDPITTPVTYQIHRSTIDGFTPSDTTMIGEVSYTNLYSDDELEVCNNYYYKVVADACGNPSDPSYGVSHFYPPEPMSATGVAVTTSGEVGIAAVTWTGVTSRVGGLPLPEAELDYYHVYYDTIPGSEASYEEVDAPAEAVTLTGLEACKTYYFNVRPFDTCGNPGYLDPGNEVSTSTGASCDATVPTAPSYCTFVPNDDWANVRWSANTEDCDLGGYRIYYGHTAGGPYDGTEADQGPSPIFVDHLSADMGGGVCSVDLTGLTSCQTYAVRVMALDNCDPPNESALSLEATGTTTCIACTAEDACTIWTAGGTSYQEMRFELYNVEGTSNVIKRITPTYFTSTAKVKEFWFGNPLVKVWAYDGSAGQDGNIGLQPSGATLDIADVTIPTWTKSHDGATAMMVFDEDVRGVHLDCALIGDGSACWARGTANAYSLIDDFDDGNYTGWTVSGGTWSATSGELVQSSTSSNYVLKASPTGLTSTTFEAKCMSTGGSFHSVYLMFRYQDANNAGLFGFRTDSDQVRVARLNGGTFTQTASYGMALEDNVWYTLKVVVTGSRVEGYINCQKVVDVTDGSLWASGACALTARKASGKFDDIKVLAAAPLP
ncbi:MAG: DUF1080 domain-containing protein [Candidatus Eisenbacteria bacterium]|nr:DUF1080 domain-containing protein [Candidatus Eisenbacteria bacterium]